MCVKIKATGELKLLNGVYFGVKTCGVFLCFAAIVRVRSIMLTSLFSLQVLRHC